jgi:quinol monooxygenase YgiN
MIVVQRFRPAASDAATFREEAAEALAVLGEQAGFLDGCLGRNVDDPGLWVLETRWKGPGAYRRALSAYDVKVRAWRLLGQALDEPTAYEVVRPGETLNDARPRGQGGAGGL